MGSFLRIETVAVGLSLLAWALAPGAAWAGKPNSTVNHGWEIIWDDTVATVRQVDTGKKVTLFRDEKPNEENGRNERDYTMLSVVGTTLSWEFTWRGPELTFRDSGSKYVTLDLTKLDMDKPADQYGRLPGANLAVLFDEMDVQAQLAGNPVVLTAIAEARAARGEADGPPPQTLSGLLDAVDGGCLAGLGSSLLTRFGILYQLGERIAVVEVKLANVCETDQGEITDLPLLYLRIPGRMAEDFKRAVRGGALEHRKFTKPSFDCKKAGTIIEFAICTEPALAKLDVAMGRRYGAARRQSKGTERQQIRQTQREWVAERNGKCTDGDVRCLTASYEDRLAELDKAAK